MGNAKRNAHTPKQRAKKRVRFFDPCYDHAKPHVLIRAWFCFSCFVSVSGFHLPFHFRCSFFTFSFSLFIFVFHQNKKQKLKHREIYLQTFLCSIANISVLFGENLNVLGTFRFWKIWMSLGHSDKKEKTECPKDIHISAQKKDIQIFTKIQMS